MSTDRQRTLDDYEPRAAEADASPRQGDGALSAPVSAPDWIADEGDGREEEDDDDESVNHRHCRNCKGHVTAEFARVSGDNDNVAHRCPNCANGSELAHGAAGIEDFEHRVEGGLHQ